MRAVDQPGAVGAGKAAPGQIAFHRRKRAAHQQPPSVLEVKLDIIARRGDSENLRQAHPGQPRAVADIEGQGSGRAWRSAAAGAADVRSAQSPPRTGHSPARPCGIRRENSRDEGRIHRPSPRSGRRCRAGRMKQATCGPANKASASGRCSSKSRPRGRTCGRRQPVRRSRRSRKRPCIASQLDPSQITGSSRPKWGISCVDGDDVDHDNHAHRHGRHAHRRRKRSGATLCSSPMRRRSAQAIARNH